LLFFCGENSYNKQTMNVDETAGLIHVAGDDYSSQAPSEGSSSVSTFESRFMLMAWISAIRCSTFDLILYLAIPQNAFQGDELPFLERSGELRENPPGIDAMPFGAGLVVAFVVLPALLGCDVEDDVLFGVLSALAARNSLLLIRRSDR
jgi:hypothetical protein